jgi:hypothetical protein
LGGRRFVLNTRQLVPQGFRAQARIVPGSWRPSPRFHFTRILAFQFHGGKTQTIEQMKRLKTLLKKEFPQLEFDGILLPIELEHEV